jgi:transcriptional regulator with XRE-family HTH domain
VKARRELPQTHEKAPGPTAFGAIVRRLRHSRDMSQAALARRCGISAGYVGLIETGERGERPSLEIVKNLAQALSCSVAETEALMRATGHLGEDESLSTPDQLTVPDAINADRRLTERQRTVLKSVYQEFVRDRSPLER